MRTVWPDGATTEAQQEQSKQAELLELQQELDSWKAKYGKEISNIVSTNGL